jgi:predicted Zn-dependent protease
LRARVGRLNLSDMLKNILIVATLALVACEPPPAWEPGDSAMTVWASSDGVWLAVKEGCDAWAMTTLTCVRVTDRSAATVEATMEDARGTAAADTSYHLEGVSSWDYDIRITVETMYAGAKEPAYLRTVMAHEVGHLLGIWEHLEDGPVLMSAGVGAPEPTTADIDALPFSIE